MKTKRILKIVLIVLAFCLLGLEIFVRLLTNGEYGVILPFIARESFVIKRNAQISVMERESLERRANPPSALEVDQMKNDPNLCFKNDDCRQTVSFYDCNNRAKNKYYLQGGGGIVSTAIGCSANRYSVCEQNKCISKTVEPVIPSYYYGY